MTTEHVGAWVKARMKAHKWSVKYVAARSGVSRQTIYALIRGEHPPTLDTQRGLAEALEVEPDWCDRLLAGQEPVEVTRTPSGSPTVEARLAVLEVLVDALFPVVEQLGQVTQERLGEHVDLRATLTELAELRERLRAL